MTLPPSLLTPLSIAACAFSVSLAAMTHDVARLLAVDARHPHAGLLAQPRRDVVLVGRLALGVRQALVDQLVDLRLGVVRAQDLAGRVEDVLALVALGAHDALEVDRGAGRDRGRGVGVGGAAGRAAAGEHEGEEEGGEGEQASSGHRTRLRTEPANCNPACRTFVCTPSCRGWARRRPRRRPTLEPAHLQGKRVRDRTGTTCCGTSDDKCVAGWDRVGYCPARTAGPGWRGSSHSATSDRLDFTGPPDT